MKTVNILGTEYTIDFRKKEEDTNLDDNDGYTDTSAKLIVVEDIQPEKGSKLNLEYYTKQVVRHEVIHAFLFESGLEGCCNNNFGAWSQNEEMVDWFAIQSPKIIKAFREADAL